MHVCMQGVETARGRVHVCIRGVAVARGFRNACARTVASAREVVHVRMRGVDAARWFLNACTRRVPTVRSLAHTCMQGVARSRRFRNVCTRRVTAARAPVHACTPGVAPVRTSMHACALLVDALRAVGHAAGHLLQVLHRRISRPNRRRDNALATQPQGATRRSLAGADVPRLVGRQGNSVPTLLQIGPVACRGPPACSSSLRYLGTRSPEGPAAMGSPTPRSERRTAGGRGRWTEVHDNPTKHSNDWGEPNTCECLM